MLLNTGPETLLAAFMPGILSREMLQAITVCREPVAGKLLDELRLAARTRSGRHHLLVGPHGSGKTHLISLLTYRIRSDEELSSHLRIACPRKPMWEVASFPDLLEGVLAALAAEYDDAELAKAVATLPMLPLDEAEAFAERLLSEWVGKRLLLLILEDLEALLQALNETGQRQLRAWLQAHANIVLLATAPRLSDGVSDADAPFYDGFNITRLDELTREDVADLLAKIALVRVDTELVDFLHTETGQDRLRAAYHLIGGSPRCWICFANRLTMQALDDLVPAILQMLDALAPCYQGRIQELPAQQRKIVSLLCAQRGAAPVKEIAAACRLSHQATAAQLHSLRAKAFVRAEALGRESWYELADPLMRLYLEALASRGHSVRRMIALLRLHYSRTPSPAVSERPHAVGLFFRLALTRTETQAEWPAYVAELTARCAEVDALDWLGQELTASLSGLLAQQVSAEAAAAWNAAWQAAGKGRHELEIPLRLLAAATQWRGRPDRRVLLRLPTEERRLLEAMLPPGEGRFAL
jgi:hypothetical protein